MACLAANELEIMGSLPGPAKLHQGRGCLAARRSRMRAMEIEISEIRQRLVGAAGPSAGDTSAAPNASTTIMSTHAPLSAPMDTAWVSC